MIEREKFIQHLKENQYETYIEFWFSDEGNRFIKGVYYRMGKRDLPMAAVTCEAEGKFKGSTLVGVDEEVYMWHVNGAMFRYFVKDSNTLLFLREGIPEWEYMMMDMHPLLIHNESKTETLTLKFEDWNEVIIVPPGECRRLISWIRSFEPLEKGGCSSFYPK